MEKDRNRRYGTANELAADIGRYLTHETVFARPPSLAYRCQKFLRKNRIQVGAAAIVLIALVSGLVVSLAMMQKAREEAEVADRTTEFLVELFEYAAPNATLGEAMPVGLLLRQGEQRLRTELRDQPAVRARLLGTLGMVSDWLEADGRAIELLDEAIEQRTALEGASDEKVLEWRLVRAGALFGLGQLKEATARSKSLQAEIGAALGESHDLSFVADRLHGVMLRRLGRTEEAESCFRESIARSRAAGDALQEARTVEALGVLKIDLGEYDEALELLRASLTQKTASLPDRHPSVAATRRFVCNALRYLGEFEQAERIMQRLAEDIKQLYGTDHPAYARLLTDHGRMLLAQGRYPEAEARMRSAVQLLEEAGIDRGPNLAWVLNDYGSLLCKLGKHREARPVLERSAGLYDDIFGDHAHHAICLRNLALALVETGEVEQAEARSRESLAMVQRLQEGTEADHWDAVAGLGYMLSRCGKLAESEKLLREALAFEGRWPRRAYAHLDLGHVLNLRAERGENRARNAEMAIENIEAGLTLLRQKPQQDAWRLATGTYNLGWARAMQGDRGGAEESLRDSATRLRRLFPDGHWFLAFPVNYLGGLVARDRPEEGIQLLEEALELRRRFFHPKHHWLLFSMIRLGSLYVQQDRLDAAEPLLLEAYPLMLEVHGEGHAVTNATLQMLELLYEKRGNPTKAKEYRDKIKR